MSDVPEMVERVKTALANAEISHHRSEACPERWEAMALAAIAAMREPTGAMLEAGSQNAGSAEAIWAWTAMIDEALRTETA